jgi:hypothetical protein
MIVDWLIDSNRPMHLPSYRTHRAGMRHPSEFRVDCRLSGQNRIFAGITSGLAVTRPETENFRTERSMSA